MLQANTCGFIYRHLQINSKIESRKKRRSGCWQCFISLLGYWQGWDQMLSETKGSNVNQTRCPKEEAHVWSQQFKRLENQCRVNYTHCKFHWVHGGGPGDFRGKQMEKSLRHNTVSTSKWWEETGKMFLLWQNFFTRCVVCCCSSVLPNQFIIWLVLSHERVTFKKSGFLLKPLCLDRL